MNNKFTNILFRDIETVPAQPHFNLLGEREKEVFMHRFKSKFEEASNVTPPLSNDELWEQVYQNNAALYAEFAKIVSVGLGYITSNAELRVRTIVSKDEKHILNEEAAILNPVKGTTGKSVFDYICGHNSDDFDNPFTCRRMTMLGIKIPYILDPTGKKSSGMKWYDTMKMFGYGQWGYKISLERLCFALGIPTPKGEIDGAQVKDLFYGATPGPEDLPFGKFDKEEARFAAIGKYQAGDIVALVNCFLRLNNEDVIPEEHIKYV